MRRARTVETGWPFTVRGAVAAGEGALVDAWGAAAPRTVEISTTSEFSLKRRPLQL
jgi:hypothetical protein